MQSCTDLCVTVQLYSLCLLLAGLARLVYGWRQQQHQQNKKFHEINGFLSLQLGLSFELGFRLRLTKNNCLN